MPESQEMADRTSYEVWMDDKLIHKTCFDKRLVNFLLRQSFARPGIANPEAVLEHEAAQNILALITAMREQANSTGAVNCGRHQVAYFNIIPLCRRHAFPACSGNSSVKRSAAILR
jgi:hypothetical protein